MSLRHTVGGCKGEIRASSATYDEYRSEPREPDHQEVKRSQFTRRFHEGQPGISLHCLRHTAGGCKGEIRARKAMERHAPR